MFYILKILCWCFMSWALMQISNSGIRTSLWRAYQHGPVVISFACQFVVFLYLLDNETSWMIIVSAGLGCCIEFWKIGKAMHIEVPFNPL